MAEHIIKRWFCLMSGCCAFNHEHSPLITTGRPNTVATPPVEVMLVLMRGDTYKLFSKWQPDPFLTHLKV